MTFLVRFMLINAFALGSLSFPSATMADALDEGFYASLAGMYIRPLDLEASDSTGPVTIRNDLNLKSGRGGAVALGYEFGTGLRSEVEIGYRSMDIEDLDNYTCDRNVFCLYGNQETRMAELISFAGTHPISGKMSTFSMMLNAYYAHEIQSLRPYLGVGIGFAMHDIEARGIVVGQFQTTENLLGISYIAKGDDTVFAYQMMAGIGYRVTENVEVRLGYRLFGTAGGDFDGTEASYQTRNFEAGIAYRF